MQRFIILLSVVLVITSANAQQSGTQIPPSDVLKAVRPEYPFEARSRHVSGSGVLVLHVDRVSGKVTSVTVQKSTGSKLLDDAGIRAFSQWRFRPGAVKTDKIWMPISFHS
jgi:TonB family protein